jgi:hypothetical protein
MWRSGEGLSRIACVTVASRNIPAPPPPINSNRGQQVSSRVLPPGTLRGSKGSRVATRQVRGRGRGRGGRIAAPPPPIRSSAPGGRGSRGGRGGRGSRGRGRLPGRDALDKALDDYQGPEAALDRQMEAYQASLDEVSCLRGRLTRQTAMDTSK